MTPQVTRGCGSGAPRGVAGGTELWKGAGLAWGQEANQHPEQDSSADLPPVGLALSPPASSPSPTIFSLLLFFSFFSSVTPWQPSPQYSLFSDCWKPQPFP